VQSAISKIFFFLKKAVTPQFLVELTGQSLSTEE
jgi:hypothetical protein